MGKIIVPIEIETEGMLEDALEIKRLADELGRKVYNFRIKASENIPSEVPEGTDC